VIYGGSIFRAWVQSTLPALAADRSEQSPAEQLDDLWARFCLGDVLVVDRHFKPLQHIADGVWELKTTDLRIFGWFPQKDHFIAVLADLKRALVQNRSYGVYRRAVVAARDALPLDNPKFITGTDPNDVVSNFAYA